MNIVFVSNTLNHHQIPLCRILRDKCSTFFFIETEPGDGTGYQKRINADFVVPYYNSAYKKQCEDLILQADAVIFGSCPNELIALRMQQNKLSFLYSERVFKKGTWRRFIPAVRNKIFERLIQYKNKNMFVLCASAYLASDLELLGFPREKCFQWGYFPEIKKYENIEEIMKLKYPASILWVARLIKLKHPEIAVRLAERLKQLGVVFTLNIIGNGVIEDKIRKMIRSKKLDNCVHMLGSMSPEQVRSQMDQSEIFLFSSDRNEGWGAVMNEAMNSGCAVIANRVIGSVPILLKHGENGFIYDTEKDILKYVVSLLNDKRLCKTIGVAANRTISEEWNADNAAGRLISFVRNYMNGDSLPVYESGVFSRSPILEK